MLFMLVPLLSILVVFVVLCLSEALWRAGLIKGEAGRKFVHIIVGTFVAFWPFLMSFEAIQVISVALLAGIIISRQLGIFHAIHTVRRSPWGEMLFAVSIGLLPLISTSRLVFTAAVLHMSVADGLAALIGTRFGKRTRFYMFGQLKSLVGSVAFALASYAIVLGFFKASRIAGIDDLNIIVLLLPPLATLLETASVQGSDNILVPLLVAAVLNSTLV